MRHSLIGFYRNVWTRLAYYFIINFKDSYLNAMKGDFKTKVSLKIEQIMTRFQE